MKKIIIFGATSAIAQAAAKIFIKRGDAVFLVGRNSEKLEAITKHLQTLGGNKVYSLLADLNITDNHIQLIQNIENQFGSFDTVLIAHGDLGNEAAAQHDFKEFLKIFQTNFLSAVSLLSVVANKFEKQGNGQLVVISSVAGDRGRQSNYCYGTAKGALSLYLQGLRNRLHSKNVHVLTIKPGFVDTPMTQEFTKKGLLWSKPDIVAKGIIQGMDKGKDEVYLPGFWRWIMLIITHVPEKIFKKLKL